MTYIKKFEKFSGIGQERLDSILDKISKHGIKSLTVKEKEELDNVDNPIYKKIEIINEYVSNNDNVVTMYELNIESPIIKKENKIVSKIEVLFEDSCLVVDYEDEYPQGEYEERYIDLDESVLNKIIDAIKNFTQ